MNGKPTWTQKCWVLSCVWSGWAWSCWRTCSRGSRSTAGSHSPSTLRFNGSKGFSCNGSSPVRSWHFAVKHCILGLWFIVHAVKARDMLHHRHEFQFEERERESYLEKTMQLWMGRRVICNFKEWLGKIRREKIWFDLFINLRQNTWKRFLMMSWKFLTFLFAR